jgi:hypothetical protein
MSAIRQRLRGVMTGFDRGARMAVREYRFHAQLRPQRHAAHGCDLPIHGHYILSSERGLYHLSANAIRLLTPIPAFGIARAADDIYLATWHEAESLVLKGSWRALLAGEDCGWRELYRIRTLDDGGRIHQIALCGESLWLANTAQNMLTKIDRQSGAWRASIAPFRCEHGHPIVVDHNHVNSVFVQPGYLLFGAFRINRRSVFGLAGDGKVVLFPYRNMGIHDCVMAGEDLFFSDSYRMWEGGKGGAASRNGEFIDAAHFDANPAHFVRGIAGEGNEILIGNSHVGAREERFSGQGALILAENGRVTRRVAFPSAQIYDILREDGSHFDRPPGPQNFAAAEALLTRRLGPAETVLPLRDVLVGPRGKKFHESDIGDIAEYLGAV